MNKDFNFKRAVTHSTVFHADEAFGVGLCRMINPDIQVIRTLEPEKYADDETIIFDIGMGEYDHHQPDKAVRPITDGYYLDKDKLRQPIPYCAFGLLWRDFGHILCPTQLAWERVDRELVIPIDKADNGVGTNPLSQMIKNMNPAWDQKSLRLPLRGLQDPHSENPIDGIDFIDDSFNRAVVLAMTCLSATVKQANASARAVLAVSEAYLSSPSEKILVMDKYMPYLDAIKSDKYKDCLFVVYPSQRGGWNVQTLPKEPGVLENRMDFPTNWLGHADAERGIHFAHPSNFLIACDTKEQAIKVAEEAIDIGSSEATCVYSI